MKKFSNITEYVIDEARELEHPGGYGKEACDEVGGLINHHASAHDVRNLPSGPINDARSFVEKVLAYTEAITLINITATELSKCLLEKDEGWQTLRASNGIRDSRIEECHFRRLCEEV
ncbi:hypothetical protein QAD02_020332 [Eretmocerus hayati]|uniref:Uncharacterized protein n=1 Tax=Eretmocerus hayati TaxID=131215 RepID=A0ACC2PRX6_9HYME|nr:hypothetical protein QAD02_020332 [Eretmocerus hayati]